MQSEQARPDGSTRLRLMTLVAGGSEIEFGGGLAAVAVQQDDRSSVAHAIAGAVIGPRPDGIDGMIEIAGRYVALQTLPAPLLRPSATPIVDRAVLDDLWQEVCAHRRARIEAAHASRRLLRHRTAAALERATARTRELAAAAPPEPAEPVASVAVPELPVDEITPRLRELAAALDALAPVASADALALADEFDALDGVPAVTTEAIVLDAPASSNGNGVAGAADLRARIEACHRAVVEADNALFEAKKKDRPQLLARYDRVVAEEQAVLAEAGIESYTDFLLGLVQGAPAVKRPGAEPAVQTAEADSAPHDGGVVTEERADEDERRLELRARAAQLLGRFPGDEPASELRALRVEPAGRGRLVADLAECIRAAGDDPGDDPVAQARRIADARERAAAAAATVALAPVVAPAEVEADDDSDDRAALQEEADALAHELTQQDEAIAMFERDLAYIDRVRGTGVSTLDEDALGLLLTALFDAYRAGELLAGRLPLVLDGAFDGLGATRAAWLAERVHALSDVQVIMVSADADVLRQLERVGARRIVWPSLRGRVQDTAPEPPPAPRPSPDGDPVGDSSAGTPPDCAAHGDRSSSAECSRCGRCACVACLVYMPGEQQLWCVECAEALHSPNLRLLGRRGA